MSASFVEMRMVDGVEVPMPVEGKPATAKTTRAYAGAALAFPYSPRREKEVEIYITNGVKQKTRFMRCPLSCKALKFRWCSDHGEVVDEELHFIGLSCGDVMYAKRAQLAAEGDLDSQVYLTDRIEGKPKQAVEAVVTNFSYGDVLNMLIQAEAENPTTAPRITVDPFSHDQTTVHLNPFETETIDAIEVKPANLLLEQI